MKRMGYIIGLVVGIPIFIILVNLLFFRGNNPTETVLKSYINNSNTDTVELNPVFPIPKGEQYIVGLSRRGRSSAFIFRYPFYSEKYNRNFALLLFEGFDDNRLYRQKVLSSEAFNDNFHKIVVRINLQQLNNPKYGTKENPVPVFPIDMLDLKWKGRGWESDPFHVSDDLNKIFVEQYLKHFMPKDEYEEMFKK